MIKLKRVYESTGKDDGKTFLVERLWPRGVKKTALADAIWLRDVAPSTDFESGSASSTHWEAFAGFTYLLPHRLWGFHDPK